MIDFSQLTPAQRLRLAIAALDAVNGIPKRARRTHALPIGFTADDVLAALSATYQPTKPKRKKAA